MTLSWIKDCPNLVTVETAWERKMVVDGSELYDLYRSGQDAAETVGGMAAIRSLLVKASEAIEEAQLAVLKTQTGRTRKALAVSVPSETLALITLSVMVGLCYSTDTPELGVNRLQLAKSIGQRVELEVSFRRWLSDSKEAAKAYAKDNGLPRVPPSQAERLLKESIKGDANRSGVRRALRQIEEYKWTQEERIITGDWLVSTVVSAMPDKFETVYETSATSKKKSDRMLPALRDKIDRLEIRRSANHAQRKPMLTPPRKWAAASIE